MATTPPPIPSLENVARDGEDERREQSVEDVFVRAQPCREHHAEEAASNASADELGCEPPVHQPGRCIVQRGRQPERPDGQERRADRVDHWHAGRKHETWHDQKTSADPEEAGSRAGGERHGCGDKAHPEVDGTIFDRCRLPGLEHQGANHDHQNAEQEDQPVSVHRLAEAGADQRAEDA